MNNNTQGMREQLTKEFCEKFTDGCDPENGYYDAMLEVSRPTEVLSWMFNKIELAVSEREKEIVEHVTSLIKEDDTLPDEQSYNQGLNDIISSLTKPSLSQGGDKEEE